MTVEAQHDEPAEATPLSDAGPARIGTRIQGLLEGLGQNAAWLSEKTGLERSTIGRLIKGTRNPTPETLREIAPVLGVTLAQLVAGTDAAARVDEAGDLVARKDYEAAVHQVIAFERRAHDLQNNLRDSQEGLRAEKERNRRTVEELEKCKGDLERAKKDAIRHEREALRYREALEKAVVDVAHLQAQVRELGASVEAGRKTGRVAAILAGVAAVVSVASYLNNTEETPEDDGTEDDDDESENS